MIDHSNMKLGRVRASQDPRLAPLRDYLAAPLASPASADWYSRINAWPMLANDEVGDCTCAAVGHVIQQWTSYTDPQAVVMNDAQVLAAYSAVSGYVPGDPATDRGALCADVLRYWATTGMLTPDGGPDTLTGAASVDPRDLDAVRRAVATFGNLYAGVALPLSAQSEDVWSSTSDAPGSWGGHCLPLVGYNAAGPICVTWGALKQMTWEWWATYTEEAYALLSPDWLRATGTDPAGVDWARLETAMRGLALS
jgi:hypothetical protein